MTRHILVLIASIGFVCGLGSCKNFLDTEPSDSESTEDVLKNYELLSSTINGLYDGLQGGSSTTSYYACNFPLAADVMGDNMQSTATGSRGNVYYMLNYDVTSNLGCWTVAYDCIRRANRILQMCDRIEPEIKASGLSDANKKERLDRVSCARAEALSTRALAHFDLLRQYATPYPFSNGGTALGVPIVLTPSESKSTPPRSTVGEGYKQIIADFEQALSLASLPETAYGRFSSSAVKGLLARVYLYMNTSEANSKAIELSKQVIDSKKYSLATTEKDYKEIWSESWSKEMIFTIVNFNSSDWTDREGLAYVLHVNGYRNAHLTKKFYDEMMTDPKDLRWSVLWASKGTWARDYSIKLDGVTEDTKIWIGKYPGKASSGDMRSNDMPIIRLSELYLTIAEAAFKNGDKATALTYLNAIVQRANPAKSVSASELTLKRILDERAKELFAEGHRFFDLMRTGERCVRFEAGKPGWHGQLSEDSRAFDHTYYRTILAIPQYELDVNPVIRAQQNPGY